MEGADHFLELPRWSTGGLVGGVAPVRCEEPLGHVSPIVPARLVRGVAVVVRLVDRQQLDRRESERLEVLRHPGHAGIRATQLLGDILDLVEPGIAAHERGETRRGRVLRQPAHVRLVDEGLLHRDSWPLARARLIADDQPLGAEAAGVVLATGRAGHQAATGGKDLVVQVARLERLLHRGGREIVGQLPRVRVEEDLVRVEALTMVIHVRHEALRAVAAPPGGGEVPVRAKAAERVQRARGDLGELRLPHPCRWALLHPIVVLRVSPQRLFVDFEQDSGGAPRIDGEGHVVSGPAYAEREGLACPTGLFDGRERS